MSIAIAFVLPGSALADTTDYQAEGMSWATGIGYYYGPASSNPTRTDPGSTGTSGYEIVRDAEGPLDTITTTKPTSAVSVRVMSAQKSPDQTNALLHPCQGSPQFSLIIDGVPRATWSVAPSTSYSTFTVDTGRPVTDWDMNAGTHTVTVKLLNDYDSTSNPCDRDIYIDKFTLVSSQIFPDTSWRNTPLADNAPLAADQSYVSGLAYQASTYHTWVTKNDSFAVPVYTVPVSQARVPVTLDTRKDIAGARDSRDVAEWNRQFGAVPIPANAKASGPNDCTSDGEWQGIWDSTTDTKVCTPNPPPTWWSDREIVIYQPGTDTLWEIYHLVKYKGNWVATDGGRITNVSQTTGYDTQPFPSGWYHGVAATRIPLIATVQRTTEVLNDGRINHPVSLHIPHPLGTFTSGAHDNSPSVLPAIASDGDITSWDAIPEGTRFRLPRSINVDALGLGAYATMLAHAAQDYGMIVTDKDCHQYDPSKPPDPNAPPDPCAAHSPVSTSVEDPAPAYGATDPYATLIPSSEHALDGFPWASLQVVAPTG